MYIKVDGYPINGWIQIDACSKKNHEKYTVLKALLITIVITACETND